MHSRLTLHEELVGVLGSRNVYFQPPENLKMNYPCIVYERHGIDDTFADNDIYLQPYQYRIIVIDDDPDSEIVAKMAKFRNAKFIRHFVSEKLNHDIFDIYY